MPAVEHIIWDWNGTLFADGPALIDSTIEAFQAAGLPPITRLDYQSKHRQPIPSFYDALTGRTLTPTEQQALDTHFQSAYQRRRDTITLNPEALHTMHQWRSENRTQSLLSMYPHDRLLPLVAHFNLTHYFTTIDGLRSTESRHKAPHLRHHLTHLPTPPPQTLLIGDSVDDARAAQECGIPCILYHAGNDALHALDHFTPLNTPIVHGLSEAIAAAQDGEMWINATSP